jgi:hypothetical protein
MINKWCHTTGNRVLAMWAIYMAKTVSEHGKHFSMCWHMANAWQRIADTRTMSALCRGWRMSAACQILVNRQIVVLTLRLPNAEGYLSQMFIVCIWKTHDKHFHTACVSLLDGRYATAQLPCGWGSRVSSGRHTKQNLPCALDASVTKWSLSAGPLPCAFS